MVVGMGERRDEQRGEKIDMEQRKRNEDLFDAFLSGRSFEEDIEDDGEKSGFDGVRVGEQSESDEKMDDSGEANLLFEIRKETRSRRRNGPMYPLRKTRFMDAEPRLELCEKLGLKRNSSVRVYIERLTPMGARVGVSVAEELREKLDLDQFPDGVWVEGALFASEMRSLDRKLEPGEEINAFIANIREDGKLDIALRQLGSGGRSTSMQLIRSKLQENDGFLSVNDNSKPDEISAVLGLSKGKFKQALGGLLKSCEVLLEEEGIRATPLLGKVKEDESSDGKPFETSTRKDRGARPGTAGRRSRRGRAAPRVVRELTTR